MKIVKKNGGVKNIIKNNDDIKELFNGYPDIFLEHFLEKYVKDIENSK